MRWGYGWTLVLGLVSAASLGLGFTLGNRVRPDVPGAELADSLPGVAPPAGTLSSDAMRELVELRQRQGSVLGGSVLDDGQDRFSQSLRRFSEEATDSPSTSSSQPDATPPRRERRRRAPPDAESDPEAGLVEQLSQVSRELRHRADALEADGRLDDADRVRRLSRRLRREARWISEDLDAAEGEDLLDV